MYCYMQLSHRTVQQNKPWTPDLIAQKNHRAGSWARERPWMCSLAGILCSKLFQIVLSLNQSLVGLREIKPWTTLAQALYPLPLRWKRTSLAPWANIWPKILRRHISEWVQIIRNCTGRCHPWTSRMANLIPGLGFKSLKFRVIVRSTDTLLRHDKSSIGDAVDCDSRFGGTRGGQPNTQKKVAAKSLDTKADGQAATEWAMVGPRS
ncbi:hypothetical protein BD289DRAFT_146945 [Coniella lustricola]|uniref:Uncharacterized protein n=1 Tax=Coniella lustricola TaxID=2025994 RepID=A0A2T2ZV28_9PEZI|nr:hypothetical protein BD289DRAFT_146945 [Coniella lustricola]